ncbi:MAG: hypothetical protein HC896_02040 [Bacteroidales bacterium]|nr:hypothetical protein [Bacteroidales bacterium]
MPGAKVIINRLNLMTQSREIHMENMGLVKFKKIRNAKSLRIIVKKDSSVVVTMPYTLQFQLALDFLEEKKHWVNESIKKSCPQLATTSFLCLPRQPIQPY